MSTNKYWYLYLPEFTAETHIQLQKNLRLLRGHLKPRHSECVSHNHSPTIFDSSHETSGKPLNFQTGKNSKTFPSLHLASHRQRLYWSCLMYYRLQGILWNQKLLNSHATNWNNFCKTFWWQEYKKYRYIFMLFIRCIFLYSTFLKTSKIY